MDTTTTTTTTEDTMATTATRLEEAASQAELAAAFPIGSPATITKSGLRGTVIRARFPLVTLDVPLEGGGVQERSFYYYELAR